MSMADDPRILLLGAGHASLLAARDLRAGLPRAAITLVDGASEARYSGMLPGTIAGHYAPDRMRTDLRAFAARHGLDFVQGRVCGLDPVARRVALADGRVLSYDLAALDLGSHAAMPEIPGFDRHAVPAKPIDGLEARLAGAASAVLIGGGLAGAEIALALRHRGLDPVTLIEAGPDIGRALRPRTRRHLAAALDRAGIRVIPQARVASVQADGVVLTDGRHIAAALTIGTGGARAQDWPARTLPVDAAGFIRVTPTLQVEGHPTLFAAGDCAAMMHAPRPKAGVFAVRQAPVLAANLIAAATGGRLRPYHPQRDHLRIIALGGRVALAEWRGVTLRGAWVWRWKDRIDRRFMARLQG